MPMALAALISGLGFPRSPRSPSEAKSTGRWFQKNADSKPTNPIPTSALAIYEDSIPCKKQEKSHENVHFKHRNHHHGHTKNPPGYFQTLGVPSVSAYLTITGSLKPWGMLPSRLSLIHFAWRPQPVTGTESRGPRLEDDDFPGIPK